MFCCFLRDAPAESNAVSTIPNQTADADTCSLAWAETATTPKQRKLAAQKNKLASKPKRIGFIVCLGHVFVSVGPEVASRPKRLRPRRRHLQPRMLGRISPDAETAQIAPRRQKKRIFVRQPHLHWQGEGSSLRARPADLLGLIPSSASAWPSLAA